MRGLLRVLYGLVLMFGWDPLKGWHALRGIPAYLRDRRAFWKSRSPGSVSFSLGTPYPCLGDRYEDSGSATGHYFHQDLLVARRVAAAKPVRHIDVGSRIDGFVAHVAAFREIEVVDIRPLADTIPNVRFRQADFMKELPEEFQVCCDSASSLHAIEHFGLGRYGDPIDYDGWRKGVENLGKMLKPGGTLYFSVPIGPMRIEFNAHRVFSVAFLLDFFKPDYELVSFSYVDDGGNLHENVIVDVQSVADSFGCHYGCGILELKRR